MKSVRKNKSIKINSDEFSILSLIKEGLLDSCSRLMSEKESKQILKTGKFKNESFPYPLSFAPSDCSILKDLKPRDLLELELNGEIVGHIIYQDKFKDDKNFVSIFNPNICPLNNKNSFYIYGEIELYRNGLSFRKQEFNRIKNARNVQKITAIVSSFDLLHRAYERIFRWTIDEADLVVIFLIESYEADGFEFELKEKYLQTFIQNYLPKECIFVFPLKNINIFHAHLNPGFESIIAKSLGCTKLVVGQNHSGLGMFYDTNQPKSILDEFSKDYGIEIIILPEFVFCDQCKMIVSTRSCPHGTHHHLHYNVSSLKGLLRAGIIPPAVFMHKEISSLILSALFPQRLKDLQQLYQNLFPTDGILEGRSDEELYQKLLEVHQMTCAM